MSVKFSSVWVGNFSLSLYSLNIFLLPQLVLSRFIKQRMLKKNIEKNLHENATEQKKCLHKFCISTDFPFRFLTDPCPHLHICIWFHSHIYIFFYIYRHTAHAWMKSKVKNILRCTMKAIDKPLVVSFYRRPKLIMMMEVVDDVINLHLQSHMKISKLMSDDARKIKKNIFAIMNERESARLELHWRLRFNFSLVYICP